jgi:probable HAF family extracellular repeat protein
MNRRSPAGGVVFRRALLAMLILTAARGASAAVQYAVTDLGTAPGAKGDYYNYGLGLNQSGTAVVGVSGSTDGTTYATRYSIAPGGGVTFTDIGRLAGINFSQGRGVNDSGQIAGWSDVSDPGGYHPFLYSNGVMKDLGALPGYSHGKALGINNAGQVVGYSYTFAFNTLTDPGRAFLYTGGQLTDIGFLPGDSRSAATAINDQGVVTGYSYGGANFMHAFLYANGTMTDLGGGLRGPMPQAINNLNQIVGIMNNHAFVYRNGAFTDLGGLPGADQTYATGINDQGVIVGHSLHTALSPSGYRAFVSTDGQTLQDLTLLVDPASGWTVQQATGINNGGQIVAYGDHNGGVTHALLLTPIPEPAAPASLCILAGLLIRSRSAFRQIRLVK